MGVTPATTRFSTAGLPAGERVRRWERWNADALLGLRAQPTAGTVLDAVQVARRPAADGARWARVRASAHTVVRDDDDVAARPTGALAVFLPLGATGRFTAGASDVRLGRGRVLVADADRPFERGFPAGVDETVLAVPRSADVALDAPLCFEVVGPAAHPVAVALAHDLVAGQDRVWRLAVLAAALAGGRDEVPDRVTFARAYVAHHLADAAMTAATVAAAVGVSERQLSRDLAAVGSSVPREILEPRLERARVLLEADPGVSPAAVARRVGLSPSYFSRRFTARFGITPGRWHRG